MFNWDYDMMICGLDIPVLFIDGPAKLEGRNLPADQLYMENTSGVYQLTNEMLKAGKRRIGFIGDYCHCESFFERFIVFRSMMIMENVPVRNEWIISENNPEEIKESWQKELDEFKKARKPYLLYPEKEIEKSSIQDSECPYAVYGYPRYGARDLAGFVREFCADIFRGTVGQRPGRTVQLAQQRRCFKRRTPEPLYL